MTTQLRGGHTTEDPRLDRLVQFDERSRAYGIRATLPSRKPRGYTWKVGVWLDQGQEGSCTGFSMAHELAAKPVRIDGVDNDFARKIYLRARELDDWPGEADEGSSVLGAAKAVAEMGLLDEYRWAFGVEDLSLAIAYHGPAVLGINWYEGMSNTGPDDFLRVEGSVVGGHAILCHAYSHREKAFWVWNSWGQDWGSGGRAKITYADMDRLLSEQGEACIPVKRRKAKP